MTRALTQSEASRLVRGEAGREAEDGNGDAEAIGFTNNGSSRLSRERETALVGAYGRLGNGLQGYLQAKLKTTVDVAIAQSEIVSFQEYQGSIDNPCSVFHFDLGTGMGAGDGISGVIDLGMRIPMLLVEVQFGGRAAGAVQAKRQPLTVIEQQSVRGLIDRLTTGIQDVWSQHVLFNPSALRYEGSPDALEIMERSEPVLVTYFDVAIKEGLGPTREVISVAIPTRALEAFLSDRGRAASASAAATMPFFDVIGRRVLEAGVEVRLVTPTHTLYAHEVARLQPGAIIGLSMPIESLPGALEVLVQDQLIARGRVEIENGQHQAVIDQVLESPPLRPPVSLPRATLLGVANA